MSITIYPQVSPTPIAFSDGEVDAFGRLRVSNPYTLFDSQNRYNADAAFDTNTVGSGTATYQANRAAIDMSVTAASGDSVVRQTFRNMHYQPGKSLLILATFSMATGKTGLQQRVGYFNTQNGVYLQQKDGVLSFVIRSYTSGAVVETVVQQSNWNGDKLNGTGSSGITIDVTKTQILYIDLEWLGVGAVRCGLVLNGNYVLCHTFYNANNQSYVYMTTAVLPVRYEITNTAVTSGASTLQQICSTVISEGGYEQTSQEYYARNTTAITVGTTFQPLVSIRLNSSKLGAVVIPARIAFLPIGTGNYEIALIKNGVLTGASWVTGTFSNVDYDISSTAMTYTAANIAQIDYATSSNQAQSSIIAPTGYNFELQIGTSLAGVSDVWTLAARTLAATNTCIGSLAFWDLTL